MAPNIGRAFVQLLRTLPLLAVVTADAQFSGLTTTQDGGSLFLTSALRQRGADQSLEPKIFRIDGNGAALVVQLDESGALFPYGSSLHSPQISGDGSLLVYGVFTGCGSGSSCFLRERNSAIILNTVSGEKTSYCGNVRISRNGRFMAWYASNNVQGAPSPTFELIDRSSSTAVFEADIYPVVVSIAANGTTVLVDGYGTGLMRLIEGKNLVTLRNDARRAVIDDAATVVVYETLNFRRLFAIDLSSGRSWQIGPDDRDSYQPVLSADGRHLLYLSTLGETPQLFVSRVDGHDWRQLTDRGDGIAEATLSDDGAVALAVSGDGSILRIAVESGLTTTVVGPTPVVDYIESSTPGSLTRLTGKGLADSTIVIEGTEAPIVSRSPEEIWFQMPWQAPLGHSIITSLKGGEPYFEVVVPFWLSTFYPRALALAPRLPGTYYTPVAIHVDFKSLVTEENPARPGELLHMYLTGGGPVTVPVATGEATPIGPLSRITTTPISVMADPWTAMEVPFIGLAPGLLGIWQMDFYLPTEWSRSWLGVDIWYRSPPPDSYGAGSSLGAIPMAPSASTP
ncbi:MAG: hypothetical protein KIT09_14695 [Bryobacteraceae bacterium]|nr:hypothetical protein [Bryobacteraceae bacterium]